MLSKEILCNSPLSNFLFRKVSVGCVVWGVGVGCHCGVWGVGHNLNRTLLTYEASQKKVAYCTIMQYIIIPCRPISLTVFMLSIAINRA